MKYIVDLDDTLINSTKLNNDAYNYALEKFEYNRIITNKRLTRNSIKTIDEKILKDIIKVKQEYFTSDWLPYRIIKNSTLINKLIIIGKNQCYLWTKADKDRVKNVLKKCKLKYLFKEIIFDNKYDFYHSIEKLKETTKSKQFVIYENNHYFFLNQNVKIIDQIKNDNFDVKGYLVR